ncbi:MULTISPECIES: SLC26A/SulP transporter family protein [Methylobacterium]|uniref:SulP family sulfate permease n=1 Tax=Methylobacterium fujisawaense TaxID=107400 RepID=A0ABR6DH23_9HYPH|nr:MULTISPECIES: cyclic nucleotide-binding domain-containing protein [Methylobacterium]MBA9065401.1 SulP family sulfate permease [Methylobacterium fujisawaense]MDH3031868.1 cyclic nucleotide-binding domain-containing protein [Methylobacterium fujisawaense]WFS09246.1 cyclic nucleotide-binding domain-containing protein [Methylobacterium sp. 391_Methyba4]
MTTPDLTSAGTASRAGGREGLLRGARIGAAAAVTVMVLLLDLISYSQLIFAGPLAESRAAGLSGLLAAYVLGSLVFIALRRTARISLSFIGAAAIVQAAIAAGVAGQLEAAGVTDPETVGQLVLVACGVSTFATGLVFALLGTLRASLLVQLLPYPVLAGFLGGVGLLFLRSGVQIGGHVDDPLAALLRTVDPAALDPGRIDAGALARIALTLGIGFCAFYLPRIVRHWGTYPTVILSSLAVVHLGLAWTGTSVAAGQAAGWLIEPLPAGSLLRPPAIGSLMAFDPHLLLPIWPKIATLVVVAVIIQILYVVSVELEIRRDLDIDRMFVASGATNMVGSLFGSSAMGFGRTSTLLLHNIGGGHWLGWWLTLAVMAALLIVGASPLALLPRPLAGGALIAIGIGLLFNLNIACRTLPGWEIAIALVVCAATAFFGATTGFLVGVLLAILIFGVQYGQIGAIRRSLSGAERRSSVIRGPDAAARLQEAGGRTRIYTLQGYLFFLNAQAIYRRAGAEAGDLRVLILDFRETVGLDSSALIAFRKVGQLAEQRGFDVLLVHLDPAARLQIARNGLTADPHIRIRDTLDEALREAEATLLAEAGGAGPGEVAVFARHMADRLGSTFGPDDFAPYLTVRDLTAGATLMRQGEAADALYFLEQGVVSIEMEVPGRGNLRLRTTTAGTVIGEIALVQGGRRTATAIAESPCRVVGIDRAGLARMERERPDLALTFQRFLMLELAGKVSDTNRLLEAEML